MQHKRKESMRAIANFEEQCLLQEKRRNRRKHKDNEDNRGKVQQRPDTGIQENDCDIEEKIKQVGKQKTSP